MLEGGGEPDPSAEHTLRSSLVTRHPLDRIARGVDLQGDRTRGALVNGHVSKCFLLGSFRREGSSLIFSEGGYSANDVVGAAVAELPSPRRASAIASREWIPSFW